MPRAYSRCWIKAFRGTGDVMCMPAQAGKRWLTLRWAGPDETERGESEALIPAGDKQSEGSSDRTMPGKSLYQTKCTI